jgi:hypothetical protein
MIASTPPPEAAALSGFLHFWAQRPVLVATVVGVCLSVSIYAGYKQRQQQRESTAQYHRALARYHWTQFATNPGSITPGDRSSLVNAGFACRDCLHLTHTPTGTGEWLRGPLDGVCDDSDCGCTHDIHQRQAPRKNRVPLVLNLAAIPLLGWGLYLVYLAP